MDDILNYLINMVEKKLTGEIEDFLPSKPGESQDEEDDPTDEFEEDFISEEEKQWQELEEQREKRFKALQSMPRSWNPKLSTVFGRQFGLSDFGPRVSRY